MLRPNQSLQSLQTLSEARKLNKSSKNRLSLMRCRINHISGQDQWNQKKINHIAGKVRTIQTAKSRLIEQKQIKDFKKEQEEYLHQKRQIEVDQQRKLMRKIKTERLEFTKQRQIQNQFSGRQEKNYYKQEKNELLTSQLNRFAMQVDQIRREEEQGLQSRYQFLTNVKKKANTKKIYWKWAKQTQSEAQKFYEKIFRLEKEENELIENLQQTSHHYQHTMDDLRGIQQSSPQELIEQFQSTLFPTSVQEKVEGGAIRLKTSGKGMSI